MALNTYSFADIVGSVVGPGGSTPIGSSSGPTDEGITAAPKEERNTMTMGADGQVMHSLHAAAPGRITVRLLKTSPVNAILSAMFNFQSASAANWGQNAVGFADPSRGDVVTLTSAAFVQVTAITFDKGGKGNEWIFEGSLTVLLGSGVSA